MALSSELVPTTIVLVWGYPPALPTRKLFSLLTHTAGAASNKVAGILVNEISKSATNPPAPTSSAGKPETSLLLKTS